MDRQTNINVSSTEHDSNGINNEEKQTTFEEKTTEELAEITLLLRRLLEKESDKHINISNFENDNNIINSSEFNNEEKITEKGEHNMLLENVTKNRITGTNKEEDDQKTIGPSTLKNETYYEEVKNKNSSFENKIKITPSLAMEAYKIDLNRDNPREEKLILVHGDEKMVIRNKILRYLPGLKISSVKKVQNYFLRGLYYLKKEEYKSRKIFVKEKTLFHCTDEANVSSIAQDNFDWRRVRRSKYGKGISFATDADYANCHANRRFNAYIGAKRAFIIAKVLVGKSTVGSGRLKIPPEGYDTTTGANSVVKVKYNDNEFLPEYVVFYDCNDITKSKYYKSC